MTQRWKALSSFLRRYCFQLAVLRQVPFKWKFGRELPPNRPQFGGGPLFLFCISIGNISWKKFLHWKLLDNICSSELEQNHQTKTYTCEFENFSDKFAPIFGKIETFQIMFVITSFVAKVTKVHVDAILRKKYKTRTKNSLQSSSETFQSQKF